MKKFIIIFTVFTLLMLTACSSKVNQINQSTEEVTSPFITSDNIIWDELVSQTDDEKVEDSNDRFILDDGGQFQVIPSDEIEIDTSKLNIAGNMNLFSTSAFLKSKDVCGLECAFTTFFVDEIALKILAGDSDVDIYLLDSSTLNLIIERGIYHPSESDIISQFNDGCFDYISEIVIDHKGQTVAMPLISSAAFVAYPIQAADELGFNEADIAYYDDFHNIINNYNGKRKAYAMGDTLVSFYGLQYEEYYCDFVNKKFDYNTELYKDIYSLYADWKRIGQAPVMTGFTHPSTLGTSYPRLILDGEKTLFTAVSSYQDFIGAMTPDQYATTNFCISDWRAVHIPWISENVNTNFTNATYAFINPYSEKYDEAVKFLEYIAENYFSSVSSYTFIREDKNEYPDSYQKETQLFDDVYEISKNGFVSDYQLFSTRNDIDDFQNGRATLDEAIAIYQREVEIWLNE